MILIRILHFSLLIIAFFYFVACPTVHAFGEDIKHDLLPEIELKKLEKKTAKELGENFFKLSQNSHFNFFHHVRNVQELLLFFSSRFTLNLAILSTIRLIL